MPSATASGSASSKTTIGALPPSSRWTRFSVSAAVRAMILPVSTSPVSETMPIAGCSTIRCPTGTPSPVTTCRTPGGMTSWASSTKRSSVSGVCSDGLRIWTFPAADDADRLAPDQRRVAGDVLARRLPLEVAGRAGEEAQVVGREGHLVAGRHQGLADVLRLQARELLGVLVEDVGEGVQELGPFLRRLLEPGGKRRLGGLDRPVDVLGATARHVCDRLAGRGRDHLHRLAGRSLGQLAADQDPVLGACGVHSGLLQTAGISAVSIASVTRAAPRWTPPSRITRWASATGITVITTTKNATTLTTGSCWPRSRLSRMKIGSVSCAPAVNVVTITSSNESANASSPPATSAVETTGQRTKRNVCQPSAPRSCEASSSDGDVRRRRATTLL